ncbi:hypothetical protein LY13_003989 [Prauserella aidingensis]|nr:hypothetical protein [Prauserella aidingensis]
MGWISGACELSDAVVCADGTSAGGQCDDDSDEGCDEGDE